MCGDGANDCGALKTADVGISLSEAESSVASPFTSHQPDIACVPEVIKEGRAALVTAFGLFKFMVLYSLVEFFSTVLLFTRKNELADMEFLYIDVALIVVFAFFFGQTKPHRGPLVPNPPSSSLLSALPLVSMALQYSLMIGMQILSDNLVQQSPFYWLISKESERHQYDNYAIFTMSQFQYIILAVTFSVGHPYREPIYKNLGFFISLVVMSVISVFVTTCPLEFVARMFEFKLPPDHRFRYIVISLSIITFVISIMLESVLTNIVLTRILARWEKQNIYVKNYSSKMPKNSVIKTSIEHLSEIEVKCYGTMK